MGCCQVRSQSKLCPKKQDKTSRAIQRARADNDFSENSLTLSSVTGLCCVYSAVDTIDHWGYMFRVYDRFPWTIGLPSMFCKCWKEATINCRDFLIDIIFRKKHWLIIPKRPKIFQRRMWRNCAIEPRPPSSIDINFICTPNGSWRRGRIKDENCRDDWETSHELNIDPLLLNKKVFAAMPEREETSDFLYWFPQTIFELVYNNFKDISNYFNTSSAFGGHRLTEIA